MDGNHNELTLKLIEISANVDKISNLIVNMLQGQLPLMGGERFVGDAELSKILKVSRKTLQHWRANGVISFMMLGGKVLYRESDVQNLLEVSSVKSFSTPIF